MRVNRGDLRKPLTLDEIAEIAPEPLKFHRGRLLMDAEIGDRMYSAGIEGSFVSQCVHYGEPKITERWREEFWAERTRTRPLDPAEAQLRNAAERRIKEAFRRRAAKSRAAAKERRATAFRTRVEVKARAEEARADNWHPKHWFNEKSGILRPVIARVMNAATLTPDEIDIMRAYCVTWIDAGCWDWNPYPYAKPGGREELARLRRTARKIATPQALENWL